MQLHNHEHVPFFQFHIQLLQLWHGCGYKKSKVGKSHRNSFEYTCVTGPLYKKYQTRFFDCAEEKAVVTGHPKTDLFFTADTKALKQALHLEDPVHTEEINRGRRVIRNKRVRTCQKLIYLNVLPHQNVACGIVTGKAAGEYWNIWKYDRGEPLCIKW